ncbi:MAG: apolipoprotein N-acyltransferase [Alphaproteobacteria bacterium]|nr:apolipoprotein N-acyltransferase [Alphaproteobacteria bacterium]
MFSCGCFAGYHNMRLSDNMNKSPLIRIVQPAQSAVYKIPASKDEAQNIAKQKIRDLFIWATNDKYEKPDLIVFPETAYPYTVVDNLFPLSRVLNTNVIMGANSYNAGKVYNSMVIADKDGIVRHLYSKSHLVPFGEYRPFGDIIPTPGQLTPGNGKELISINTDNGEFAFAPAICYEIIFSDSLVPRDTNPDAIINITNDTWFGLTPGVYQHLDMVRRYAIESGLPIVRANYSGISAFVGADGNVISMMPVGETGAIDGFVWGGHNTPYRAIGRDLWMAFILMFSITVSISISLFQKKD